MQVSPPKVLLKKDESGKTIEPYEDLIIEVDDKYSGKIIENMAAKLQLKQ